ncbi:hypothetical protein DSO57_1018751 [Entomophthora muscae]|uniref:Uncharacterized protein n=1 Tax=Entomophthora muscae TaxID=34485 RepID=A0ACC2RVF5_9FUNG|nr:hypothetical protein DSO57_1018751 [Entomophthora muscae]
MKPLVTPKPMSTSAAELSLDHTKKLFGIVYITLAGVIDTIVPAASPWSWVGKSMSYLIKLAPILWWALPTQSANCPFPNTSKLADQGWFPDTQAKAEGNVMRYIIYNLIQSQIITRRWDPAVGTLSLSPNVNLMPQNLGVFPTVSEAETLSPSKCPKFYT